MTIDYKQDFEGGSNGTALDATNTATGGNHPFDVFSTGGTGSINFSSTSPIDGSLSALLTAGSAAVYLAWNVSGSPTRVITRFKFKIPTAWPTVNVDVVQIFASATARTAITLLPTGGCVLRNNGVTVSGSSATTVMVHDTEYTIEIYIVPDAGSSGALGYRILNSSETVLEEHTFTGLSGLTGPITQTRYGNAKTGGIATIFIDSARVKDLSSGWIGPDPVNPTANAGPDQINIEPFATVNLTGAGSTSPDSGTLTYAWTQTSGTTVTLSSTTSATPSFAAPATLAGSTLTFSLTVTEAGVDSLTPDTVNITVLPHPSWRITNPTGPVLAAEKQQIL